MGKLVLRSAQLIGGLACLFFGGTFILIGVSSLFSDDLGSSDPQTFYIELLPNLILIFSAIICFIIFNIKKKYKIGGILLISFGIALFCSIIITKLIRTHDLVESIRAGSLGGMIYGPPFILSGVFYLASANSYESIDEK
ncbi:hypothetical protein [Candidatus Lokiarchaeum ossiferum]|uniref:hypothetical protein n=1 Tax=Candidatus Lokiarchaeum ossiferum TaxID=2951803 RepID=UPI00352D8B27